MKLAGAYINDDTYERLVALAVSSNRTLAGQCRHLFDRALKGDLTVPDGPALKPAARVAQPAQTPVGLEAKPHAPVAAGAPVVPVTTWEFAALPGRSAAGERRASGAALWPPPALPAPAPAPVAGAAAESAAAGSGPVRTHAESPTTPALKMKARHGGPSDRSLDCNSTTSYHNPGCATDAASRHHETTPTQPGGPHHDKTIPL